MSTDVPPSPPPHPLQTLLGALKPPAWVVDELQNRLVLALNHVLQQEPAAMDRLRRQRGKPVRLRWGEIHLMLAATPAGLLERADPQAAPDLTVTLTDPSPLALVQTALAGQKPAVDIQGDVLLAAEVAWLVDNVRWDAEEDLARVFGDAPAHTLAQGGRALSSALRALVSKMPRPPAGPSA